MILLLVLVLSEFPVFLALRQHYKGFSKTRYYLSNIINVILSIYLWILYIEVSSFKGQYDDPSHVWLLMNLNGAIAAILFPRVIFIILHFTGKALRYRRNTHIRLLSDIGLIFWILMLAAVIGGSVTSRFHYRLEKVTVKVPNLNPDLDGITIAQLSDMHMITFHRQRAALEKVMTDINKLNPDIIINSGDFVEYGYREYQGFDTILAKATSKYGKFAVLGNHDIGTYYPGYSAADIDTNINRISGLIRSSGYTLLKDENCVVKIGGARLGIAGTITRGRYPHIQYGDFPKTISGMDSLDFRILIDHDPNHWEKAVAGKTKIELTLSGHTHGMQIGIITKKFRWSPSKYFYPHWNGLYESNGQFHYVNRGLGVIHFPFRIFMPPEVTFIRLERVAE